MRIGDYLKKRRENWLRLETLLEKSKSKSSNNRLTAPEAAQFSQDYRSACSDLAMVDEHRLPSTTARYLHNLVGRCHNQFYGTGKFTTNRFFHNIFTYAPQRILNDVCVQISSFLFFGLFIISALAASSEEMFPKFANSVLGEDQIQQLEISFSDELKGNQGTYLMMSAFYIQHNTSIGLRCFGEGILILPCLVDLVYNAVVLGASFGYMAREDSLGGENFFEFTLAHGPFELTAIVLSAAAGLRIGVGFFVTNGLKRFHSIQKAAHMAVPIILSAVVLFMLAAFTEGCISPTSLPYTFKAFWAVMSSTLMMVYFVVLGTLNPLMEEVPDAA